MDKIPKTQAMLNHLIANVIVAESEYNARKISLETFRYAYNTNKGYALRWLPDNELTEFRNYMSRNSLDKLFFYD